ncbi:MAG: DNA polymerase ligase N-terminal domain-containing protein [Vicinamibacterales bacterium]
MALDEYKRKRDFSKTPEPSGEVAARKGSDLFFCVQKHLASHLHYDFRLEYNGVLLSWAVPKGPSLDPSIKRLAMQTEDHPFDYGEFEGVIPEGYGAGIVMLWDRGTWTPEVPDVDKALAKGDLKFTLDGYKLKGSWVLVRTSGRYRGASSGSDGRSWLLIKHRDDWSGDLDITTFAPLSVKSEGDFADILAADNPAVWHTNRPAKAGDTGAMFTEIIERAATMKAGRQSSTSDAAPRKKRAAAKPAGAKKTSTAAKSASATRPATSKARAPRKAARSKTSQG